MKIIEKNIDELIPYARNPRKNDQAVDAVAASIKEFGFKVPIVLDKEGVIVAGHTRAKAARKLGLKTVPCLIADDLTDKQIQAYRILDNRVGEKAEWDAELLAVELEELDLDLAAFDVDFDDLKLDMGGEVTEDEVPEVRAEAVSRLGDLWLLGDHRVLCGDSTNGEHVGILLDGRKPFIMVTDPPYGVEYDPGWRSSLDRYNRATGEVSNDDRADWAEAWLLFPGTTAYVWHAGNKAHFVATSLLSADLEIRAQIVWHKPHFVLSRGHYHGQHEPCWYAVKKGQSSKWCGDRKQSTTWEIANALFQGKSKQDDADKEKTGHGTQKPVECMARPIRNHGGKEDDVYDPFLGSGTTIIAAEQLGRKCYGLELEPTYVDVIVRRWQNLTGKEATLERTGQTFAGVEAERLKAPDGKAKAAENSNKNPR